MALKNNTWKINQWYDQAVAGNISYTGEKQLYMVGRNNMGQLGQNDRTSRSSPVQVTGIGWKYIAVSADYRGIHGVKTDGTLWSWGESGTKGQSGTNNNTRYSSPVQVPGTTWDSIANCANSAICTKTDGTLWSWGYGRYGQLANNQAGPGSAQNRSSPIQVGSETTWSENVSAGSECFSAVKTDGTLWMWGKQTHGKFAQNGSANVQYSSPVQIPGTSWSTTRGSVQVTGRFTLAVKTDGTLWSWGDNDYGQLGQNQPENSLRSSPVQIDGTDWKYVAGTANCAFATKSTGELYGWGWGDYGEVGLNNTTTYKTPQQIVDSSTDWDRVYAGSESGGSAVAAIKTDGTMFVWGKNEQGQTGLNDTNRRSSPTQLPGTSWIQASPNNETAGYIAEV